jgi:hypothetical protein
MPSPAQHMHLSAQPPPPPPPPQHQHQHQQQQHIQQQQMQQWQMHQQQMQQWQQQQHQQRAPPGHARGRGGGSAAEVRPGDWMCPSCGNHNFASRTQCYRCQLPRRSGGELAATPHMPPHLMLHQPPGGTAVAAPPPHAAAAVAAAHHHHHPPAVGGEVRAGDWMCASCGNHNYASRQSCYRCGIGKSTGGAPLMKQHGAMWGAVPTGSVPSGMRPGDWICQVCNNHNFASKTACNRCQTAKGLACQAPHGVQQLRVGDWLCESCSNVNFASRQACNKCNRPKTAT